MGGYDAWKESGPHDDCGSTEQVACDRSGCREPWAWEVDSTGEKLCEAHADAAMLAPAEMAVTTGGVAA